MPNIDLDRVEKRYTIKDISPLLDRLRTLSFEEKYFSDKQITLTYFCDTKDLSLPDNERIKIRTYVTQLPSSINFEEVYKLNFKTHKDRSVSEKEVFEGTFKDLLKRASRKFSMDIIPVMAMSYKRSHFVVPENTDIRVTLDQDIIFHKIVDEKLIEFHKHEPNVLEIKYNPLSSQSCDLAKEILSSVEYKESDSKKNSMYKIYKEEVFAK